MPVYKVTKAGKPVSNVYKIHIWYGAPKPKQFKFRGTRAEAEVFEAQKRLELRAASPSRGERASRVAPTFSEFCLGAYAHHAEKYLAKGTRRNRNYQIAMLIDLVGDTRLDRFSIDVIRWIQDQRLASGTAGPAKVNDDIKTLVAILNTAAGLGVRVTVPQRARRPGMPGWRELPVDAKGKAKAYEPDDIEHLYSSLGKLHPQLLGPTVAMLNTGMRRGETLVLEWSWVDVKRRLIFIEPNEFWRPKDNEPREVPISDALMPWLTRPRQHPRWVFPTLPTPTAPDGDRYQMWPQRQWDAARELSGVGGSPHMCRHTFASHFLAEKDDIGLLAQIMGHSRTRTTELYTHFRPSHLAQAHNVVNFPVPARLVPVTVPAGTVRERSGAVDASGTGESQQKRPTRSRV